MTPADVNSVSGIPNRYGSGYKGEVSPEACTRHSNVQQIYVTNEYVLNMYT